MKNSENIFTLCRRWIVCEDRRKNRWNIVIIQAAVRNRWNIVIIQATVRNRWNIMRIQETVTQPQPIEEEYDFSARSPIKPFKANNTNNK